MQRPNQQMQPRIALLNPNTNKATTLMLTEIGNKVAAGRALFEGHTMLMGPPIVTNEAALLLAERQVVMIGENLAVDGVNGLLIAGFGDPGLADLRSRVPIPVTGIAEAGIAEAAKENRRFSIITTTPDLCDAIHRKVEQCNAAHLMASLRVTPGDLETTMSSINTMSDALSILAAQCINEDGAEAILVGGGPLAPAAQRIAAKVSVPIIDPVVAGAKLALDRYDCGRK